MLGQFGFNDGVNVDRILDQDNMSSDSVTALATQQSIKAYVDNSIGAISSTSITEGNSSVVVADSGTGTVTVTIDGATHSTFAAAGITLAQGNFVGDLTGNADTATTASGVALNSVALGTDTTGNYVAAGATTGNGISGSVSSEGGTFTVTSNATNANTASTIVFRDVSGNFSAGTITANLTGTATAAQYSDLAERFAADTVYEPGTVVALGGAEEITATQEERSESVFGVVSGEHQAAFKMNGAAGTNETHPYIAMAGRVQVKVLGAISKGDRLVTSIVPGVARRAERDECTAFNVIGRALEHKHTDGLGEVLCFVTAKS